VSKGAGVGMGNVVRSRISFLQRCHLITVHSLKSGVWSSIHHICVRMNKKQPVKNRVACRSWRCPTESCREPWKRPRERTGANGGNRGRGEKERWQNNGGSEMKTGNPWPQKITKNKSPESPVELFKIPVATVYDRRRVNFPEPLGGHRTPLQMGNLLSPPHAEARHPSWFLGEPKNRGATA